MKKFAGLFLAVVLLAAFTEADALKRFDGGWQADDPVHGFAGAIQIDAEHRTIIAAAYSERVEGTLDEIKVMGTSAIFTVGESTVVIYSGSEPDVIEAQVGSVPPMRFVRVE